MVDFKNLNGPSWTDGARPLHPDPPTQPFTGRGFPIQSARIPGGETLEPQEEVDVGGGGNPGVPATAAVGPNPGDKLIGNPPPIFTGDRTKSEAFMSNWKKYCCANKDTTGMAEPYTRATLFLTYIQGGNTTEWVDRLGCYAFGLSIRLPYADLFGLLFYLSILIPSPGIVVIIVPLHRDLCYPCTIQSATSTTILGRCISTFA